MKNSLVLCVRTLSTLLALEAGAARAADIFELPDGRPASELEAADLPESRVTDAPRAYTSLPARVSFVTDDEATDAEPAMLPEGAPEPQAVRRVDARGCAVELRTAAISVSTHERIGHEIFIKDGGIIPRSTMSENVGDAAYVSIGTDVDAVLVGSAAAQKACRKILKKAPIALGALSLATTKLSLRDGKDVVPMMAIAPGAAAQKVRLALDPRTDKVLLLDARGMPTLLESGVYMLRSGEAASFQLVVEPGLHLQKE